MSTTPTTPTTARSSPADSSLLGDLAVLLRPKIAGFVLVSAFVGAALGLGPDTGQGSVAILQCLEIALWVTLTAGASSVFNQVLEREVDGDMVRTRLRPLPSGRLSPRAALSFGTLLCLAGVLGLALRMNLLSAALALGTTAVYVVVYTPMKRLSSINTLIGALPGAMPPVLGYCASAGQMGPWAWILFAVIFIWQVPHFMAIAWLYRGDYAAAGMRMLPAMEGTEGLAGRQAALHALALLPISVLPYIQGLAGGAYAVCSMTMAAIYLAASLRFARGEDERGARMLLLVSLIYLPAYLVLLLFDPGCAPLTFLATQLP
ncbi:MAG: heme o synthase [Planctomycetota bacterium]|nr:protoheme IX farnesyltransferase [Planctomycetota bacterium]MDP6519415.1 heme o synthase [Planctomycetota bacterium]MDP6839880.1 heme o synthase [Planctomycetota bacterium]